MTVLFNAIVDDPQLPKPLPTARLAPFAVHLFHKLLKMNVHEVQEGILKHFFG